MNAFVYAVIGLAYVVSLYFTLFLLLVFLDRKELLRQEKSTGARFGYPLVSIFIPAYNEEKTVRKTLESVWQLEYPHEKLEVMVINDGSTDNTKKIIKEYIRDKPGWKLLSQANRGKATALNKALAKAKGEFFACLDADSFVEKTTLKKMLSFYYRSDDPALAVITPAMKVFKPENLLQKIQWFEYIVMIFFGRLTSQLDSLYVAPGPFSLYKTKIIRELGGFDQQSLTEDQEIAYRVQQRQYRIQQCFDGYVYTTAPRTLRSFYRQRRRWYLGSISCLHKYRQLLANRRYGDFGLMQMVKNAAGFVLALTGMGIAGYLLLFPFLIKLKNLLLIKFNVWPYLLNFKLQFSLLKFLLTNFYLGFLLFILAALGLLFFYYAHKNAQEQLSKVGWIPLVPYAAFYYLLKGAILLVSLAHFTRNRAMDRAVKW